MNYLGVSKVVIITLLLLPAACAGELQTLKKDSIVTSTNDPVIEFLSTQNKKIIDLTEDDIEDFNDELFELVEKKDDIPISINHWVVAPNIMNKTNSTLLTAYLLNGIRSWEVNLEANTFLLLRHWVSGKVWASMPYLNVRRGEVAPKSATGEEPDEFVAASWHSSVDKINIMEKFKDHLPDGSYSITQVYYDKKSNTEHFTFSKGDPSSRLNFPKISSAEINDSSINIEIEKADNASTWNLNVIALRLDEDPIIMPFKMDLTSQEKNLILTLPIQGDEWQKGVYQLYIDGGDQVKGPIELKL